WNGIEAEKILDDTESIKFHRADAGDLLFQIKIWDSSSIEFRCLIPREDWNSALISQAPYIEDSVYKIRTFFIYGQQEGESPVIFYIGKAMNPVNFDGSVQLT